MSKIMDNLKEKEKIVANGKKDEIANAMGIPKKFSRRLTKSDLQEMFFAFENVVENIMDDKGGENKK